MQEGGNVHCVGTPSLITDGQTGQKAVPEIYKMEHTVSVESRQELKRPVGKS